MRYAFGIDVGGTMVKTALVTETGQVVHKTAVETEAARGFEVMVDRLHQVMRQSCQSQGIPETSVEVVGVGLPAFLSRDRTRIVEAVNLGWRNVPLKEYLERAFERPTVLENDANVAALGESWRGAGRGAANVLCITVGTGIGGGIVLDGQLLRGANGMAGEVGHLVIKEDGPQCNCGHRGCVETLASATAIIRRAKELQSMGRITGEREIHGAVDVFQLAAMGESAATEVIQEAGSWLGYGIALAATITNPEKVVVGGGVSHAGDTFLAEVRRGFEEKAIHRVAEAATIVPAELGNDAGVIGAARLALQQ